MPPVSLSDAELDAVMAACQPLTPTHRDEFLRAVAAALAAYPGEVGPGVVYRVVRETQKRFFDPPDLAHQRPRWSRS